MNSSLLGEQIAKFRKALGMTQEDLGRAVGISAQAVSRWECGGAPDVALLPGLADALGVTIDALFGREGGEKIDIKDAAGRWLQGLPSKKRMEQLCRLIWSNVRYFLPDGLNMPEIGYLDTCQPVLDGGGDRLMISQCQGGGGILVDIHAEDLSFVTLWPKPENGYAQWLAPKSAASLRFWQSPAVWSCWDICTAGSSAISPRRRRQSGCTCPGRRWRSCWTCWWSGGFCTQWNWSWRKGR